MSVMDRSNPAMTLSNPAMTLSGRIYIPGITLDARPRHTKTALPKAGKNVQTVLHAAKLTGKWVSASFVS